MASICLGFLHPIHHVENVNHKLIPQSLHMVHTFLFWFATCWFMWFPQCRYSYNDTHMAKWKIEHHQNIDHGKIICLWYTLNVADSNRWHGEWIRMHTYVISKFDSEYWWTQDTSQEPYAYILHITDFIRFEQYNPISTLCCNILADTTRNSMQCYICV